ncbi:DUF6338 family protein [Streptomyces sp. DSM 44915]|uniref:DUF6338 family protein n=1 Tax=Streptomyces chisholmiae TaxID=3075540 RepID=A0ABU2JTC6_9ACTN|nr:DUF6338 family protein [Streptomyces sp. DSM 44915]MDT0268241.1 DUF6338 family protein [Streptomyces sp. DSM 44915]
MGQSPSTVVQLALLALAVLPGAVYQFLRERFRGPVPGERELGERVLRALVASILLDAVYALLAGPALLRLLRGADGRGWDGVLERPRMAGLWALVLLIAVPALAAGLVSWRERRRWAARFQGTPTAWDHMFRARGSCFVRIRLKDGRWVGGWYGGRSYASSYPHPPEIFLESAWRMRADGGFERRVAHTAGLRVLGEDMDVLEFLSPPPPAAAAPAPPPAAAAPAPPPAPGEPALPGPASPTPAPPVAP